MRDGKFREDVCRVPGAAWPRTPAAVRNTLMPLITQNDFQCLAEAMRHFRGDLLEATLPVRQRTMALTGDFSSWTPSLFIARIFV